jgi:hypothetical protein
MIFGKFDERSRSSERMEVKMESKPDLRKPQPIVVEPTPQTQPE